MLCAIFWIRFYFSSFVAKIAIFRHYAAPKITKPLFQQLNHRIFFDQFYSLYSFISKIHFNDFTRPLIGALLGQQLLCGRYIDNMLTIKGTAGGGKINTPPAHKL